jgi:hypothetical protein
MFLVSEQVWSSQTEPICKRIAMSTLLSRSPDFRQTQALPNPSPKTSSVLLFEEGHSVKRFSAAIHCTKPHCTISDLFFIPDIMARLDAVSS